MKRYTMRTSYTPDSIIIRNDEDINGEWVKYEDVKEATTEAHGIGYWAGYNNRTIDESTQSLCNCMKHANDLVFDWWICPAHGYKKR